MTPQSVDSPDLWAGLPTLEDPHGEDDTHRTCGRTPFPSPAAGSVRRSPPTAWPPGLL